MSLAAWWPLTGADDLRDRLLAAYADSSRHYHDVVHLSEVLTHLSALVPADHPARRAIVLAAWFHDAVYDGERDDEERSALLASWSLAGLIPAPEVDEVVRLVRLTATHEPAPDDDAGGALCDADLAILASPPDRYPEYVAAVRDEYSHLSDTDFASGRAAILRALLAKPLLFHWPAARDRWEAAARANVAAELARLV